MKQTIRRYSAIGVYGVNQDGHNAASVTYHGTDHHGVCDNCSEPFIHGWMVRAPCCECGRYHSSADRSYCLACVTVVPPVPRTPNLA